ncbi:hypothetical protein FACS189494_12180 [Spirochaetia bacterium]|nr:hypothetical protein FACS189494_12180 [Spirochaetia bacterium]
MNIWNKDFEVIILKKQMVFMAVKFFALVVSLTLTLSYCASQSGGSPGSGGDGNMASGTDRGGAYQCEFAFGAVFPVRVGQA